VVVPRPETPHAGGQVVCRDCGSHIRWQRKEENLGRRQKSKIEPGDHCERCNLQRDDLPDHETLESHHRDGNPQNNAIENIETLCTACHTQLHHDRFYRGHFAEKTQRLGNDVVRYLVATSLATSAVEKVRGILGIRDESS